jgi:single-strand DNA-binding protein
MATLNLCQFMGRLGKDPEFTMTPSGTPCAKFSLAVDKLGKDKEGNRTKETLWLNMVAWGKTAEFVEKYASKGSAAYVQGHLDIRGYTDREGIKRQAVELIAEKVQLMESKQHQPTSSSAISSSRGGDGFDPFLDSDELP